MSTTEPAALVEHRAHIMLITLNRPTALNAINAELSTIVGNALERAEADHDIRVVVLTGSGDRAFCAGADLKAMARGESLLAPGHEEWGFAGYAQHPISKPTIAAVNGFALGGGTELALASDLVVAAQSAVFALPEVKRGVFAGAGGTFRLPAQIPRKIALEMMFTGEPIDAPRALSLGLINRVVPGNNAVDAALELAGRIAANAPLAVQATKRLALGLDNKVLTAEANAWRQNTIERRTIFSSADAKEGALAFVEKRAPIWAGR